MLKWLLVVSLSLTTSQTLAASNPNVSGSQILKMLSGTDSSQKGFAQVYIAASGNALNFANFFTTQDNSNPLFCAPPDLTISPSIAVNALKLGVKDFGGDFPPAYLIIKGLRKLFPC